MLWNRIADGLHVTPWHIPHTAPNAHEDAQRPSYARVQCIHNLCTCKSAPGISVMTTSASMNPNVVSEAPSKFCTSRGASLSNVGGSWGAGLRIGKGVGEEG